jgi:hypothetical protein
MRSKERIDYERDAVYGFMVHLRTRGVLTASLPPVFLPSHSMSNELCVGAR